MLTEVQLTEVELLVVAEEEEAEGGEDMHSLIARQHLTTTMTVAAVLLPLLSVP